MCAGPFVYTCLEEVRMMIWFLYYIAVNVHTIHFLIGSLTFRVIFKTCCSCQVGKISDGIMGHYGKSPVYINDQSGELCNAVHQSGFILCRIRNQGNCRFCCQLH